MSMCARLDDFFQILLQRLYFTFNVLQHITSKLVLPLINLTKMYSKMSSSQVIIVRKIFKDYGY
jgi:hypothetical protein